MEKIELEEKVHLLEKHVKRLDSRYKQLRTRQYLHRGDITGEQADEIRTILRGHLIAGPKIVDFEPSEYVTPDGVVDIGRLLWWIDTVTGKHDA